MADLTCVIPTDHDPHYDRTRLPDGPLTRVDEHGAPWSGVILWTDTRTESDEWIDYPGTDPRAVTWRGDELDLWATDTVARSHATGGTSYMAGIRHQDIVR